MVALATAAKNQKPLKTQTCSPGDDSGVFFATCYGQVPSAVQRVGSGGLVEWADIHLEAMLGRIGQAANLKVVEARQASDRRLPTIIAQPQD